MSNSLVVEVKLPNDFSNQLRKEITAELALAQKKWKIKLTAEQEKAVREATQVQLLSKVSGLAKNSWALEPLLTINVAGGSGKVSLAKGVTPAETSMILLNKNGWSITEEETDSAVPFSKLYEEILRVLFTWTRTAVFYGVGSYA